MDDELIESVVCLISCNFDKIIKIKKTGKIENTILAPCNWEFKIPV